MSKNIIWSLTTWDDLKIRYPSAEQADPKYWLKLSKPAGKSDKCLCGTGKGHTQRSCNGAPKWHYENLETLQAWLVAQFPTDDKTSKDEAVAAEKKAANKQEPSRMPGGNRGRGNDELPGAAFPDRTAAGFDATGGRNYGTSEPTIQTGARGMVNQGKFFNPHEFTQEDCDPITTHKGYFDDLPATKRVLSAPTADTKTSTTVMTNYLNVTNWPKQIHQYTIEFGALDTPRPDGAGDDWKAPRLHLVRDQKEAMRALAITSFFADASEDGSGNSIPWATDYKDLWTLRPLDDRADNEGVVASDPFKFTKTNGVLVGIEWVKFKLSTTHLLSSADLRSLFVGQGRQPIIRALNAFVMRHVSQTPASVIQVGANKFFFRGGWSELQAGVFRTMRGYYTSLRPALGDRLLLNVNTATSAFFKPMLVSEFIQQYTRGDRNKSHEAMKSLTGVEVRITYQRSNRQDNDNVNEDERRRKYISEFCWPLKDQKYCKRGTLECYKVCDYYSQSFPGLDYGRAVVNVGGKVGHANSNEKLSKGLFYPQEFLEIVPHQVYSRVLNKDDSARMVEMAANRPHVVANRIIKEGLDLLGISDDTKRQRFNDDLGLKIGKGLLEIPAHKLTPPVICYGGNEIKTVETASWNLRSSKFDSSGEELKLQFMYPGKLDWLYVVWFDKDWPSSDDRNRFDRLLRQTLQNHGISVKNREFLDCTSVNPENLQELQKKFAPSASARPVDKSVFLVILPNPNSKPLAYGNVKKVLDCEHGIKSVCCLAEKLATRKQLVCNRQGQPIDEYRSVINAPDMAREQVQPNFLGYLSNIALKFNFKLGGDTHHFQDTTMKVLWDDDQYADTIVLGSDVTHPSRGSVAGTPSIAAVVGNNDINFMNFPGSMRLQRARKETITEIGAMVKERLRDWKELAGVNERFPTRMLFYRDGVGEDQYSAVESAEILDIEKAYRDLTGQEPQLTFVVVTKRHHTRFFPRHPRDTTLRPHEFNPSTKTLENNGNTNLAPGLLVDRVITAPRATPSPDSILPRDGVCPSNYDFYLQSHQAIKGTARSAHYTVLKNSANFTVGQVQNLTHTFCYAYARATKGVSYCAPAYYADRLCARGSLYLARCGIKDGTFELQGEDQGYDDWLDDNAAKITDNPVWCRPAHRTFQDEANRKNPWSPRMDSIMFYL